MEHRLKREEDLDELLGVEGEEQNFEKYLKKKEQTWNNDPIAQLSELEILESLEQKQNRPVQNQTTPESKSAPDAEASLDTVSNSTGMLETGNLESVRLASDVGEKRTELQLHRHDVVGTYITEVVQDAKVDEEWKQTYINTYEIAVVEMTTEQVIKKFHAIDRMIYLMRAQQQSLRGPVLEQLLRAETSQERERLLELDKKERAKSVKRSKGETVKKAKPASGVAKPGSTKGKSRFSKAIDTLFSLRMSREAIEAKLKESKMFDDTVPAYLDSLFGK